MQFVIPTPTLNDTVKIQIHYILWVEQAGPLYVYTDTYIFAENQVAHTLCCCLADLLMVFKHVVFNLW